ncbi:TPA: hypothetical protein KOR49_002254 [Clostridioides difficile]|uniref:Uncharacterized protein n=1 Tax=Clostridioides difficile TaxID=1496 RepID=A0AAN5VQ93_CLODI|nr:hypothetical protein [Clostridioides difficile]EGT3944312.1 hypothetical protein [Clostridioides difficile]MCA0574450.1 hypothetical protein [Clostridioides difficile]MDI3074863.1 hypothetical protein [Clostridioides difficile]MDK3168094.1 hypothetical protein [Clostridioides difficile]MDW0077047.1 hypothetical protein [Clostridioides difficile]
MKESKIKDILEKFLIESSNRHEIRKKNHIWMYLVLLPPYGLYKAYRNKAFSKHTLLFMLIAFIMIFILTLDTIAYPNRVLDSKVTQSINNFKDIGTVRRVNKEGILYKKFFIYNTITTKGEYDVYLSNNNNTLKIDGINQTLPNRKMIYKNGIEDNLNGVFAEIIRHISNDNKNIYGKIKSISKTYKNGQIINTEKGTFNFEVKFDNVINVFKLNKNNIYTKIYSEPPQIKIPNDISKIIKRNRKKIGNIKQVISYNLTPKAEEYIYLSDNGFYYKIVKDLNKEIKIFKQK